MLGIKLHYYTLLDTTTLSFISPTAHKPSAFAIQILSLTPHED